MGWISYPHKNRVAVFAKNAEFVTTMPSIIYKYLRTKQWMIRC